MSSCMTPFQLSLTLTLFFAAGTSFSPPCRRIDAAVRWSSSNVTYFFSADEYIVHNDVYNAEEDVSPVSQFVNNFPGHLDAAVTWFSRRSRNGKSFYFKGCYYYKFSETRRRLHRRRRLSRLRLPCDLNAAVNIDDHTVLFFKGCQYWTVTRSNRRATLAGLTRDLGLPCDVDAALTWHNGSSYVIKGDVLWALSPVNMTADYQSSLEEWNLCSWRVCGVDGDVVHNDTLEGNQFACNGDSRFCTLTMDQLTMAGAHNAGSGFDGGFGFFNCWIRNQDLSVLEQLRLGVRFLDVDSSWEHCGLLGTFHNFMCGGSVCKMLKQIKRFLQQHREEVVAINFNHEMREPERVLPALLRQIASQLGHYVSSAYRDVGTWPLLGDAVRSDKRLFVIVDHRVTTVTPSAYLRHRWIHSERLLRSTWRGDVSVVNDCQEVIDNSRQQCQARQDASLLEVSVFGYSTGCVTTIADLCLPTVHQVSRQCQEPRHARGKAPNVLLVDFPERTSHPALSVVWAAFLQNVRNVFWLSSAGRCSASVGAAVWWTGGAMEEGEEEVEEREGGGRVVFYSGGGGRVAGGAASVPLVYDWRLQVHDRAASMEYRERGFLPATADAAFRRNCDVCFVNGCDVTCFTEVTSQEVHVTSTANITSWGLPCHVDAALTTADQESVLFLKGCQYWTLGGGGEAPGPPHPLTDFGLPCDLDGAFRAPDGAAYFFKGDHYWRHNGGEEGLSAPAHVLDWSADFVHC